MKHLYSYYSKSCGSWLYLRMPNELQVIAYARSHGDIIRYIDVVRCLFKL